jgi:hypothetical protein
VAVAGARPEGQGGWWLGTAGVALALAACGWVSVAARRARPLSGSRPGVGPSTLRVLGRTNLSPRHTVYLLEAGDRVLIVGTGPQGAPSLLGELTDAESLGRVDDATPARAERFDHRLGDES